MKQKTQMGADVENQVTNGKVIHQSNLVQIRYADPFAEREGKTLTWRNVNMTLMSGNGVEPDRKLLDNIWGEVPPGETTAIMGPSGAGKSSLLNILAGRASSRGRLRIEADIRLNNFAVDPTRIEERKHIAFVAQDDSLQITSTPREAIRFSAKLRLSRNMPDQDIDALTERVLTELGLLGCSDTMIGGALTKGLSGGERKRTSVGVELVVKPALIYLDEPTSGLDSFSAVQLCKVLKKVANAGASVLFTIHQPNSKIFNSFDRVILLNKGRVMYQGTVPNILCYFADRGYPIPRNYNPADWIMHVAQSVYIRKLEQAGFFPKDTLKIEEPFQLDNGGDALLMAGKNRTSDNKRLNDATSPGIFVQTTLLFSRELNNMHRDFLAFAARFGLTNFLTILVGAIFYQVGESDASEHSNLNSRFGALIMLLLMSMFGTAQPALQSFPEERPVFLREYSTNHYSAVSYFLSRLAMEAIITGLQIINLVMIFYFMVGLKGNLLLILATVYSLAMASTALAVLLGCTVEVPKLATELLPIVFVPQMLFSGFFVRPDLIPSWLQWPQYLSTLTYAVRIILVEELRYCGDNPIAQQNCDSLLRGVKAIPDDTWWNWVVLVVLFAVFRLGAFIILKCKATKFY